MDAHNADTVVRCQVCHAYTFDLVHEHCSSCGAVSLAPLDLHGAQADDPVPNESDCCFPCGYHNCMLEFCEACEEAVVWNETKWEHLVSPTDGHIYQSEPPEHWSWVLEERARIDGSIADGPP